MNRAGSAAAALLPLIVLAACGTAPATSPGSNGANVSGVLERGPVPTCPTDEPCDPPAAASMLVFSRPGHPDVTVRVGGDGSFATHLESGDYFIAAQPPPFHARLEPSNVRVPDSGSVELTLRIVSSA